MKKQVKRIVYLVLSFMLVLTSILGGLRPASAAGVPNVTLSSLTAGDTVNFSGKTWIVLDPSTGYLLLLGSDSTKAFDPDNTNSFDISSGNSNNIGYYLNNDFYNSLDSADRSLIQSHSWGIGNEINESSVSVDCKIGLISYSESLKYMSFLSGFRFQNSRFWIRTPRSSASPVACWGVDLEQANTMNQGLVFNSVTSSLAVSPALYLDPGILVSGDSTHTVVEDFHTVYVLTNSSVGGMATGGGKYANMASVTLTATANSGYSFVNWSDENGASVSTTSSYSYTMGTVDTILIANFQHAPIIPTITVVNGVPFSVTVYDTYGTLIGTNATYGIQGTANESDTVISGTPTSVPSTLTDISLGSGTIKIIGVNKPSTTLVNASFY